jgi:hypothetical protein
MTIVVERGESETNRKIQYLVYFINEVLSDSKTQYFHIMRLSYALLHTSHKLVGLLLGAPNRGPHTIDYGQDIEQ